MPLPLVPPSYPLESQSRSAVVACESEPSDGGNVCPSLSQNWQVTFTVCVGMSDNLLVMWLFGNTLCTSKTVLKTRQTHSNDIWISHGLHQNIGHTYAAKCDPGYFYCISHKHHDYNHRQLSFLVLSQYLQKFTQLWWYGCFYTSLTLTLNFNRVGITSTSLR